MFTLAYNTHPGRPKEVLGGTWKTIEVQDSMACTTNAAVVAGVDGCRKGWLSFVVHKESRVVHVETFSDFASTMKYLEQASIVAVDIPIGLADCGARCCDVEARRLLGRLRRSSVFPAPVRAALYAMSYEEACRLSRNVCGKALSKQTYAILSKIRQVDEWISPESQKRVREVHPEASFWALNGECPMPHRKAGRDGQAERLALLLASYPKLPDLLSQIDSEEAEPDDLLDAAVAAWTAERISRGIAKSVCADQFDDSGLRMEIAY